MNNLGLLLGRAGRHGSGRALFPRGADPPADYGEASNNLAVVLVSKGQADAAVSLLEDVLTERRRYQAAYITLAKIHFNAGRTKEGIAALERLLQRNPKNETALELLRQQKR